jgi:hypothetical protein
LLKITDSTVKALFFASTYINIGDGKNTPFWEVRWLQGAAPRDIVPNLFKLARYKRRSVHTELHDYKWIRNLKEISSPVRMNL